MQDARKAFRRSFRGLILGTACFMAVTDIAFLGPWTILGGSL